MCVWSQHEGGSIMVWGCLTANGVGDLAGIDGIMNAEKYRQILIHHAIPSGKRLIDNGFIFQQDNDPNHTAQKGKSYLEWKETFKDVQVIKWLPLSPNLNIIESLWDYLDQKKKKRAEKQPKSKEHLWELFQNAWNNIPYGLYS